jgi:hypothetical protein
MSAIGLSPQPPNELDQKLLTRQPQMACWTAALHFGALLEFALCSQKATHLGNDGESLASYHTLRFQSNGSKAGFQTAND